MTTTIGTAQASLAGTTQATTTAQAMRMGMWESAPMSAQTLPTGTWTLSIASSEANAASNYQVTFCLYVWRPSTGAMVGSALYDHVGNLTEPGTTETAATLTTASITGTAVSAGDILVCEIWRASIAQGGATARVNTFYYDGTTEASTTSCASFLLCNGGTISFPAPETSPSLELYGFAIPAPPYSADTINSVTVAITEYQSSSAQAACTFSLWDYSGTPAQIGTTQTGTASTSSSNVSSATFTGVTYAMLATLRVQVFGNAVAGSSYVETVESASLVVNYTPSPNATVTLGGPVTASASIATPSVNGANIFPAAVTATAAIATPMVNGVLITPATVAVTASVPAPAVNPAVLIQPGIPAAGRRGSTRARARIGPAGLASAGISPARAAGTGNATVTIGSALAVTSAVPAPAVSGGATASPSALAVTTAQPAPAAAGGAGPAPAALAVTSAQPSVSVSTGETASPAAVTAAASVPPPALSTGVTLAVSAVAASTAFPAGTASGNAAITRARSRPRRPYLLSLRQEARTRHRP